MRPRGFWIVALPLLFLAASARPSWAWRGGWGWSGPRVGIDLWPGPYWWGNSYPSYDPYYYPPPPYAYPPYAAQRPASSSDAQAPVYAQNALKQSMRDQIEHDYQDGDISKSERDARLRELDQRAEQAVAPASSEPPAPLVSRRDLSAVTDLHLELITLLDQKLKDGGITPVQQAVEAKYLDQMDQEAHDAAAANGGTLPADQEADFVRRLHKAYYAINHNLVFHE